MKTNLPPYQSSSNPSLKGFYLEYMIFNTNITSHGAKNEKFQSVQTKGENVFHHFPLPPSRILLENRAEEYQILKWQMTTRKYLSCMAEAALVTCSSCHGIHKMQCKLEQIPARRGCGIESHPQPWCNWQLLTVGRGRDSFRPEIALGKCTSPEEDHNPESLLTTLLQGRATYPRILAHHKLVWKNLRTTTVTKDEGEWRRKGNDLGGVGGRSLNMIKT